MWGRKSKIKLAKIAFLKAGSYAYRDRRNKKRDLRGLQIIKINAAARANGLTYGNLINKLKSTNIELDRKILATLAERHPAVFNKILKAVK
jgi:large subunit ribosomal protein L20